MEKINLNHWFVENNDFVISLVNFHVNISIKDGIKLNVVDSNDNRRIFNFNTIEEAFYFTESVINRSNSMKEIDIVYKEDYYKMPNNKIILSPSEIEKAIIEYYGSNKGCELSVEGQVSVNENELDVVYYLIEQEDNNKICLSNDDVKNVLINYLKKYNYELVNYKYIGDVYKTERKFWYDIDYDGIELSVRERGKKLILK